MRIEEPPRRRRLVSLTPLIDVVFILLIFFMLASSFVEWQAFSVDAPGGKGSAAATETEPLRLHVEADGRYRIGDEALGPSGLQDRLQAVHAEAPERRVQVLAAAGAPVRSVVRALDAASAAGLRDVALLREDAG